ATECEQPTCLGDGVIGLGGNSGGSSVTVEDFDWDDDGENELYIEIAFRAYMTDASRGRIWTFKGGAIEQYARTADYQIRDVEDVDLDGRPDLVGGGTYSSECEGRSSLLTDTVRFLAHSLEKGAFSLKDDSAKLYAKKQCPDPEATVDSQKAVLCARAWGRKGVEAAMEKGCAAVKKKCGHECED